MNIDPLLGNKSDLEKLCRDAKKLGIGIILDGVFSHTGADSRYFNKNGRYTDPGAFNHKDSPYRSWYRFDNSEIGYKCWWGVPSLPEVDETDENFNRFINGQKGVIRYWMSSGISGWRLDVADELPDIFLDNLRRSVKSLDPDCFILGEVWEDASNKISYDRRRRFLRGQQLDSVMNYPFCNAIIDFVKGGPAENLMDTVLNIIENYPPQAVKLLMNHIGTHDTARIVTRLAEDFCECSDRSWQSRQKLSDAQRTKADQLLRLAAVLQYTLPGIPSLYYGDEIGLEGYGDPFCRGCFDWDRVGSSLNEFYKSLGQMRYDNPVFNGDFTPLWDNGCIAFKRSYGGQSLIVAVNPTPEDIYIPINAENKKLFFGNTPKNGQLLVKALDFCVFQC